MRVAVDPNIGERNQIVEIGSERRTKYVPLVLRVDHLPAWRVVRRNNGQSVVGLREFCGEKPLRSRKFGSGVLRSPMPISNPDEPVVVYAARCILHRTEPSLSAEQFIVGPKRRPDHPNQSLLDVEHGNAGVEEMHVRKLPGVLRHIDASFRQVAVIELVIAWDENPRDR